MYSKKIKKDFEKLNGLGTKYNKKQNLNYT